MESMVVSLIISIILLSQHCASLSVKHFQRSPLDCGDIDIEHESGIYKIYPQGSLEGFYVYLDMDTEDLNGAWTVFQRRINGEVDFYREWADYEEGFGTVKGEHWLGNDKLHILTSQGNYELLISMKDFENHNGYAKYKNFKVGDGASKYKLTFSNFTGNVGDSFAHHNGKMFSTKDQDHDNHGSSCATMFKGGWWYGKCHNSNLNGRYLKGTHTSHADGIEWESWKGSYYSLKTTTMMMRRMK
ncbi:Angiopoietin-related protein 1,Ficolin-1-A,Angiopoietin-1,Fibrinogen C domain-containing protein 1,Ryncolin-1,Tenascin-N,Angiopoietin-related protein 7,Fibrinogen C domain-containing protein 1-B,Fibrinogen-like protein 1,Ficolin-1,Ficolin-1-B,Angiopoietin-4,Tenascin-R,Ryncolin-2,Techylectin-5B,Fibrinogen C domain-containing protein 1-A,Microfibril-associated glycoprotein 4,Fibrinogen-like protein A,Ryncolin-3,Angiopoietin-2,Ficolin-2,Tenascin,Angiopoietin-related protein 2,Techylectin-5A,Ryncolin-4 [Mytilu|uniref:Fibrinogen C-terminal domain-containing protein n=1 Tax=Mytilus edulis TaxID=6550 RepID=A0A8S3UDT1_MYTED|nr:Angiopoietin-related protein 1,Ficolin-1-A,Angiopoietin-1,Fibrinogen C domain-containing protein 1,Ryncolin-1,Tenascin-N,Angiopoietin-related protein 7,Fibrinogen C domain-containing protein 1-B,Fibrinogen-like protein 1,Ficolin-1,Ficolin-1-B,Angiopoietin-4,Tenascin-R,Ryncolin-2,Techylectin-5B,Fibrinogen C domain-containing protein 1-A,Microfibril-associated glycoprotein 4,Fibrinogen-like protein A,Ryncolin-3,Angiopoietin-2,Ficolin-2,Tenascin,Angiopoietin-related protein 2,Techylectin-5A,Ryncoli